MVWLSMVIVLIVVTSVAVPPKLDYHVGGFPHRHQTNWHLLSLSAAISHHYRRCLPTSVGTELMDAYSIASRVDQGSSWEKNGEKMRAFLSVHAFNGAQARSNGNRGTPRRRFSLDILSLDIYLFLVNLRCPYSHGSLLVSQLSRPISLRHCVTAFAPHRVFGRPRTGFGCQDLDHCQGLPGQGRRVQI